MNARRRLRMLAAGAGLLAVEGVLLANPVHPVALRSDAALSTPSATVAAEPLAHLSSMSPALDAAPHLTVRPTSTPTPVPAPVSQPAAVAPAPTRAPQRTAPPAPAPPAPAPPRTNWLVGGGVNAPVTWYSDCSGKTVPSYTSVSIDTCDTQVTYFLGHNYGLFTPLMSDGAGTHLTYYDGHGTAHGYVIEGYWDISRAGATFPSPPPGTVAEFQTCVNASATVVRVFYADAG